MGRRLALLLLLLSVHDCRRQVESANTPPLARSACLTTCGPLCLSVSVCLQGAGKCVRSVEGVSLPMSKEAASGSRRAGLMVPVPARDTRLRVTAEGVVVFRHASEVRRRAWWLDARSAHEEEVTADDRRAGWGAG